ncbi:hypothetical protein BN7_2216 [Wickerhamomyces ciferrii]|uniref:YMC020W-like alpha/beta hydrolase domain-containing protein n=1 Tax=Wickerhamomyces ciferrii (strain ATCC 14091 / BCRC 22168 / CBS 111 / JCM 3599 / NBRC 0793 / NRRL Y-1031 F-60-10) TaxID=1206466 RepID=K0KKI8_WICCF|nr:uncharacterized protein BN7_2216 [Wickerhamomyces ciferrii]CCH42672.1 hypothetical protein BN7_2216 [Wickerhamomyces ciferrii]
MASEIPPVTGETHGDGTVRSAQDSSNGDLSSSNLSTAWKYWKKKQGSAENTTRKISSIDPLEAYDASHSSETDQQTTNNDSQIRPAEIQNNEDSKINNPPQDNNQIIHPNAPQAQHQQWQSWLNPFSYLPQESFSFPGNQLPSLQSQHRSNDNQSEHSSTLSSATPTENGWFGWIWPKKQQSEENLNQEMLSSIELKRNLKEAKKAIQNPDSIWAWYQNHYNDRHDGEISVLETKTETSPVEMNKFPMQYNKTNTEFGDVVPKFDECYREITTKTTIRIATELYYNYPTEKHLYIKKNTHKPLITNILVVSVTGKTNKTLSAKSLSSLAVESIKDWYSDKETSFDYQIESVSLEAAKINEDSSEDLFKLLINWREQFKTIDFVFFAGYDNSVPLSAKLLEIMIERNLFTNSKKFGLLSVDGIIPGPYLDEPNKSQISYCPDFNHIIVNLIELYNVKFTIIGTLNSIPGSLALHLKHPNIFRSMHILESSYENTFEVYLFQLLLIAHNLGHPTTRLLIQLNKFFNTTTASIADHLDKNDFHNAIKNSLNTTSLFQSKKITLDLVNDSILDNEYNLIWTLHAFVDDFKKIKNIESHKWVSNFITSYKDWDPQSKSLKELKYMLEVLKIEDYCGALLN